MRRKKGKGGGVILVVCLILIVGFVSTKLYNNQGDLKEHETSNKQVTEKQKDNENKTIVSAENNAIKLLGIEKYHKDSLGILLRNTENYKVDHHKFKVSHFEKDATGEELGIIPRYIGSKITFYDVSYEGDKIKKGEKLYEIESVKDDNSIVFIKANLPCGMPNLKVVIENGEERAEYIFTYDGKGDKGPMEYILKSEK